MALRRSSCRAWAAGVARRAGELVDRHGSLLLCVVFLLLVSSMHAEATTMASGTPWGKAALGFCGLMVGVVGKALAVVALIYAGVTYSFGEGASKTMLAGVVFGAGMVLMAPQMLSFFFGDTGVMVTGGMCTVT